MKIAMIGTGYVGLVSGACFSEFGVEVTCVDKDHNKIRSIEQGKMPIYEPGLEALVARNVQARRLHFSTDLKASVAKADAVFIAVGTPSRRGDGHADLSFVYEAAAEIATALTGYTVVVTKSTVPVGTGREVAAIIRKILDSRDSRDSRVATDSVQSNSHPVTPRAESGDGATAAGDIRFDIVSNPEFLREGSAIEDFLRPDRVVIGTESESARQMMRELYRPLFLMETPMVFTSVESSELIKYAANGFLATKISFINEISNLCEAVGCDVQDVAHGIGLDGRIGKKFLHAGPGYGGSCFPKDTLALIKTAQDHGTPLPIVEAVQKSNEARKKSMAQRIIKAFGGAVDGKTIAVLGVSFKPNTDDMRDSPSLEIIPALQAAGAKIRAFDPEAMVEAAKLLTGVEWCEEEYCTMDGADGLVIITEWNRFRALDLAQVKNRLKTPLLIDLRNIYRLDTMSLAGFDYHSIGRKTIIRSQTPYPTGAAE